MLFSLYLHPIPIGFFQVDAYMYFRLLLEEVAGYLMHECSESLWMETLAVG